MENPFDQFDEQGPNPFDQFDVQKPTQPTERRSFEELNYPGGKLELFPSSQKQPEQPRPTERPSFEELNYPGGRLKLGGQGELSEGSRQRIATGARPVLEYGGSFVGAALGAPAGPVGAVAGGTLGYAIGAQTADLIEQWTGTKEPPKDMAEAMQDAAKDVAWGLAYETMPLAVAPVAKAATKGIGKIAKPVLAKVSGVSETAISEAIKDAPGFKKALKGKIEPNEIVENAIAGLNTLKDKRRKIYKAQLAKLEQNADPIDFTPIKNKLEKLLVDYNVKVTPQAKGGPIVDFKRSSLTIEGKKKIKEAVESVYGWGSDQPWGSTPIGLDELKKKLGNLYKESSSARGFITPLKETVKNTIIKNVPEYRTMLKDYEKASQVIDSISSDLSLKNGNLNRKQIDTALRKLTIALKSGSKIRREFVEILSKESGENIMAALGGAEMKSIVPKGLTGSIITGGTVIGLASFINPKFLLLISASSPRVQAEFLRTFGKATRWAAKPVARGAAKMTAMAARPRSQNITLTEEDFNTKSK